MCGLLFLSGNAYLIIMHEAFYGSISTVHHLIILFSVALRFNLLIMKEPSDDAKSRRLREHDPPYRERDLHISYTCKTKKGCVCRLEYKTISSHISYK